MALQRWPDVTTAGGALSVGIARWLSWWLPRIEGVEDLELLIIDRFPNLPEAEVIPLLVLGVASIEAGRRATALGPGAPEVLDVMPIDPFASVGYELGVTPSRTDPTIPTILPEYEVAAPTIDSVSEVLDDIRSDINREISDAWRRFRELCETGVVSFTVFPSSQVPDQQTRIWWAWRDGSQPSVDDPFATVLSPGFNLQSWLTTNQWAVAYFRGTRFLEG